ncbi:hypothetical protein [Sphingomonas sp.]|uniref:hypothetical protein n=1 Tax=Sphingomonas sp. TaxID=28214 RepID=UPI003B00E4F1
MIDIMLGGHSDDLVARLDPRLNAVDTGTGQITVDPHVVQLRGPGWSLTVDPTRFSSVDFDNGLVIAAHVSPQSDYLLLEPTSEIVDRLQRRFVDFGFRPRLDRTTTGEQLRAAMGEIDADPSFHREVYRARRGDIGCSLVMKKTVPKGSTLGRAAGIGSDLYLLTLTAKLLSQDGAF